MDIWELSSNISKGWAATRVELEHFFNGREDEQVIKVLFLKLQNMTPELPFKNLPTIGITVHVLNLVENARL